MSSMQPGQGMPPGQGGYIGGPQRRMPMRTGQQLAIHIIRGVVVGVVALGIFIGGIGEITLGLTGGAVVCFVIAIPLAYYDLLIWFPSLRRRNRRNRRGQGRY